MRILAVDDEEDTRQLAKDLLVPAGHQVTAAADAVEALLHLQIRRFDLLLLDLMMPGIEGERLAQMVSVRWNAFDMPILVVSCRTDLEARVWSDFQGCVGFLHKPFGPSELLDAVRRIERRRPASMPREIYGRTPKTSTPPGSSQAPRGWHPSC